MRKFITTGEESQPTEPSYSVYDRVFGRQYKKEKYSILDKSSFLGGLHCKPSDRSELCNQHILNLYEASTGEPLPDREIDSQSSVFLDWDWRFAVSSVPTSRMLLGAMGFERSGDGVYVSYLYVRNHYKGMGVGSSLLSVAESIGNRICLLPEDDSSKSWYKSKGYQESKYENNTWIKEKFPCQSSIL